MPDASLQRTLHEVPWTRLRLSVPRTDRSLYAIPDISAAIDRAAANRELTATWEWNLQGRTVAHLRDWTRRTVLTAAREYTAQWTPSAELPAIDTASESSLYVSGHQPALFHPGVWVKNLAIGMFAERSQGISLNLVVDNDTFSSTSLRVPVGDRWAPRIERIPFDAPRSEQPWEGAEIADRTLFESFAERVEAALRPWGFQPLLREFWPAVLEHAREHRELTSCFTAARNRLERSWGVRNLELPISQLCELDPFLWFASHVLVQLPRFQEIHNRVLTEYRWINRVRSRTHPVPDLQTNDDWREAPFWLWRTGDLQRSRLWARQQGRELQLSDGRDAIARLPITPDSEACCAVEVLRELPKRGFHLRTRALTTTLFSRICLADLFVHGIGGSKYDEMTDRIIARFGGIAPPAFMTLSATLQLPLEPHAVTENDRRNLQRQLRDLEWNPERLLGQTADPEVQGQRQELANLLYSPVADPEQSGPVERRRARRERMAAHVAVRQLKQLLGMRLATEQQQLSAALAETEQLLQANAVLQDREYSFVLYPADKLRQLRDQVESRLPARQD